MRVMARISGVFGVVVVVCLGLFVVGGVGQCVDEEMGVKYVGVGKICDEMSDDGLFLVCDNYAACRVKEGKNYSICKTGGSGQDADYPYGQKCESNFDCFEPQQCVNDTQKNYFICDYVNMSNGYGCERDFQCASGVCLDKECQPVSQTKNNTFCGRDADCSVGYFCGVDRVCTESLKQDERCDFYADSTNAPSQVCDRGLGCFPDGIEGRKHTCQPIFSANLGTHCGQSPYFCKPEYFCNLNTEKCDNFPDARPSKVECDSNALGVCPQGSRCVCGGTVAQGTETFVCEEFSNGKCIHLFEKYYSCLSSCFFDPFTLANNDASPMPSEFLGPLNRFSCAAQKCQEEYDSVVKCQNDGSKIYASSSFTPVRVPDWARYYDLELEGWQLAVLVLVALVGIVLSVSLVVMINKYKKGYETYV